MAGYTNIDCRTFHSFGMQLIQKATGFYSEVDQKALGTSKLSAYFDRLDFFAPANRRRKHFYGEFGSFHETAKVVNSVRVSTAGITRCRQSEPSRESCPQ